MRVKILSLLIIIQLVLILLNVQARADDDTRILINIPSRTLELFSDDKLIKTYRIGVGRPKFQTPIGNFKVITKISNPGWENPYKPAGECDVKPGAKCPLGTRWIGFYHSNRGDYGIHGTNEPFSVGKFCSHGCIRMRVKDSEELFDKVDIGTPVKVCYYTYKLYVRNNLIKVHKYPHLYKYQNKPEKMIFEQIESTNYKYTIYPKRLIAALKLRNNTEIVIGKIKQDE